MISYIILYRPKRDINNVTCLFFFSCQAVDKGPPHDQNVTAQVVITVIDVNDNSPVCQQPQSAIPLFLLAKVNEEVYTVSCSDRDRSPEFNQLRYAIKSQSVDGSKFLIHREEWIGAFA